MLPWKMDRWKFYDVTHRRHVLCNPTSLSKLDDIIALLGLKPGARVVGIACGKGELLARLAERYGVFHRSSCARTVSGRCRRYRAT